MVESCERLIKVVVNSKLGDFRFSNQLGFWGVVTKSWFKPKHPLNPAVLENVVSIKIYPDKIPPDFETEQRMKNLENFHIK
jgi:hypothetical protein